MKILEGKITSIKMEKTAVVEVSRVKPHPLYRKLIRLSKKYKVDNTGFEDVEVGSFVKIQEIKPLSKDKYFKISEILTKDHVKKTKTKKTTSRKESASKKEAKKK